MDSVLMWIVTPIFLAGLAQLIFGGRSDAPAEEDERYGSGYYASREEAEQHGAHNNSNYAGSEYSLYEDGPGHYD